MGWDLWGPSYNQVAQESSSYELPGWQCDFYFGYGFDVIEEDALNEKSCVQVLRVLITGADTEIDELEKDLVFLQSELAWAEYEEWSEICCNALREKIDYLDTSIKSLRNKNDNDIEVHLLMHTEPAERLHEILKALFRKCCLNKDEQALDGIVLDSSGSPEHANDLLDDSTKLNFTSNISVKEENKGTGPTENFTIKLQEKKSNNVEKLANVKDSSPHSLKLAAGHSSEKKVLSNFDSKSTGRAEPKEHGFTPEDKKIVQNSPLQSADMRSQNIKLVKVQPADIVVKKSSTDALKHVIGHSDKRKKSSDSDSKVVSEEGEEQSSISMVEGIILDASLKPEEKRVAVSKKVKPANAIIKIISPDALRHATGLNARKNNSASGLGAFRQAKSGDCDVEQKLCDFSLKAARKRNIKESKVAPTDKIDPSNSFLKTGGMRKNPLPILKVGEVRLTNTEHSAFSSPLGLQGEREKDTTKLQAEEKGNPQPEEVQMSELPVNENFNLNSSLKPQRQKAKRNMESNPPSVQEPGFPSMGVVSNSCSILKAKKQRKSGVGSHNADLNQSLSCKIMKKLVQPGQCEAEDHGAATDDSENSQKKRTKNAYLLPIGKIRDSNVKMDFSKFPKDPTDDASNEVPLTTDSYSVDDSCTEAMASSSPVTVDLKDLKLCDLRALARQNKVPNYYKLQKNALVEQLANLQGCC